MPYLFRQKKKNAVQWPFPGGGGAGGRELSDDYFPITFVGSPCETSPFLVGEGISAGRNRRRGVALPYRKNVGKGYAPNVLSTGTCIAQSFWERAHFLTLTNPLYGAPLGTLPPPAPNSLMQPNSMHYSTYRMCTSNQISLWKQHISHFPYYTGSASK